MTVRQPAPWVVVVHRGPYRVAVNLSPQPVVVELQAEGPVVVELANDAIALGDDGRLTLPPDGAVLVGPAPDRSSPGQ